MSSSTSSLVAPGEGYRPPFIAVQWQELEHQALIYKYLVAGLPVPLDLVIPIRRSLEALSARFFHHPTLGYCSYYGKKFDPELGRCRRTDGKKWRCSKDAYPYSKYCERHMHRGRNRSRKHVESQSISFSQSVSTTHSHIPTGSTIAATGGSTLGSFQRGSSGENFQNSMYSVVNNSEGLCMESGATKLKLDNIPYGITKDYRYVDEANFSPGTSGSMNDVISWPLLPSQVHSTSLLKERTDSHLQPSTPQLIPMPQSFDPILDSTTMTKQRQQHHYLFGSGIGSPKRVKQDTHLMRSFFDEWPKARESWASDLNDSRSSNKTTALSSTQLSMSIPMAHPSDYSSRNACSPDDT